MLPKKTMEFESKEQRQNHHKPKNVARARIKVETNNKRSLAKHVLW